MPFIGPLAAAFRAALTDSFVAGLSTKTVRSTTLTLGVGTRMAYPSSLPFSSGMTRWRALAATVELGIMLMAAARARRRSLCGRSRSFWSLVYEWMVVMVPLWMPKVSWRTLATGARQLVVQEALEMTWCAAGL